MRNGDGPCEARMKTERPLRNTRKNRSVLTKQLARTERFSRKKPPRKSDPSQKGNIEEKDRLFSGMLKTVRRLEEAFKHKIVRAGAQGAAAAGFPRLADAAALQAFFLAFLRDG